MMDKNSMPKTSQTCKLKIGKDEFLDMAFANKSVDAKIICPCKNCGEENSVAVKVVKDHLMSDGFAEGCAKIIGAKVASIVPDQSQTSDENKMNVTEEANDMKLFKDFAGRVLSLGLKGRKLHDFITNFVHHKHGKTDLDKSISMLIEFTKELLPVRTGAGPHKTFSEEEDKKTPAMKQNQLSALTFSVSEEEDKINLGEKRNQPSASTSSGSAGYSPKEENRRKLREKINQRKESRSPWIR